MEWEISPSLSLELWEVRLYLPFKEFTFKRFSEYEWKFGIPPITPPETVIYRGIQITKNGTWRFDYLQTNYSLATLEEAKQVIDELLKPPIFEPKETTYRGVLITQTSVETFEFYYDGYYVFKTLAECISQIDLLLAVPPIEDMWEYRGFTIRLIDGLYKFEDSGLTGQAGTLDEAKRLIDLYLDV